MDIDENIYRTNGFRILGLDITSKNRKIDNRISRIDRYMEKNDFKNDEPLKGVFDKSKNDFLLPVKPEPSYNEYHDARNRLYDVETRLVDEIFWFWPKTFDSKIDEEVLDYLKENKYDKAISYWENPSDANTLNMTSIHNLAVIYHVRALDGFLEGKGNKNLFSDLEMSLNYWSQIVSSDNFKNFVKERVNSINDPRLNEEFVDKIFDELPYNLLNINLIFIRKNLNSGKLNKRKQDYVLKYINSIRTSPFEDSIISSFTSKITDAIGKSIKDHRETFDSSFESASDEEKSDMIIEYSENILPYLSILHDSFKGNVISENLINDSCNYIYRRIPSALILIVMKVAEESKFNKFMEIIESLNEYTTDNDLKERLKADLEIGGLVNDPSSPQQSATTKPSATGNEVNVTVKDTNGNSLSNVDVILTNMETNQRYFGETNSSGSCSITDLPSGRYSYQAQTMGHERSNGTIMVNGNEFLNISLKKEMAQVAPKNEPITTGSSSYGSKFCLAVGVILFIVMAFYVALNFL